jgi:G3E family GTPase
LIEASGVSDPGRIARILNYRMFRDRVRIDAILNLVDAGQFSTPNIEFEELARWQMKSSDIVIINKIDQCSPEQLAALKREWLLPQTRVLETTYADVPMSLILGVEAHTEVARPACSDQDCGEDHYGDSHETRHDEMFESASWQSDQALDLNALKLAIEELPADIYRAKGVFKIEGSPGKIMVLQMVGSRTEWSEAESQPSQSNDSSLVMIARRGLLGRLDEKLERTLGMRRHGPSTQP